MTSARRQAVRRAGHTAAALVGVLLAALAPLLPAADLPLGNTPLQGAAPTLQTQSPLQGRPAILPAEQAFPLQTLFEADGTLLLQWDYPGGFLYLYRHSITLHDAAGNALPLELPPATTITDEFFGDTEVYFDRLQARLPVAALGAAPGSTVELQLGYQGCAKDTYCYPPRQLALHLTLPE